MSKHAGSIYFWMVLVLFMLNACAAPQQVIETSVLIITPSSPVPSIEIVSLTATSIPAQTNTPFPAASPTPTPFLLSTRPAIRDYLQDYGLSATDLPAEILDRRIISFAPLDSNRSFLIAYFVEGHDDSSFPDLLHFMRLDKTTNVWMMTEVSAPENPVGACHPSDCFELGVVTNIIESENYYFAYMHHNPSAGWTVVLTHDLELYDVLYGYVWQVFDDGVAIYDENIIHFAPTHYTLMDVYDPLTKESRRIFPLEPYQALWLERMELLAQTYTELGETWCQEHNHHCAPELMNYGLASDVVVNDETDSLAFVISFSSELLLDLPDETRAVYVFRGVHNGNLEYREVSEESLHQLFGGFELEQLLEAENLDLIFTQFNFIE